MKVEYFPETDTLSIVLARTPYESGGAEDAGDPDVLLHLDRDGRVAEVAIEHASKRVDLTEVRRMISFEEVRAERAPTAEAA